MQDPDITTTTNENVVSQRNEQLHQKMKKRIGYVYHPALVAAANLLPSNIMRVRTYINTVQEEARLVTDTDQL
jgi:transcription initiation factor TFIID subunit TAF12